MGRRLGQLWVGRVGLVCGYVVARVHEPGGEAAAHPVDDRSPGGGVALLEPEEVDLEDLSHGGNLPPEVGRAPLCDHSGAGPGKRSRSSCLSTRSAEHTSELQSLMSISYAVFCLKKKSDH